MFRSNWIVLAVFTMCLQVSSASAAQTEKQQFAQAMELHQSDPGAAILVLTSLGDAGYARALDRLGYFYFTGNGVEQDLGLAVQYYEQAVTEGQVKSLVSLGKVYLKLGDYDKAEAAFQRATADGILRADVTRAWAHATGRFGPQSDTNGGFARLSVLAGEGNAAAELSLLSALSSTPRRELDAGAVLQRVEQRAADGEAKAAETLLRYYRLRKHPNGTPEIRAQLLETEGVRPKVSIEEALYLALETNPASFWTASEELVRAAPSDAFARSFVVAARINKNAYVRIVQRELSALGYKTGRRSPYLNAPLIRSINQFCRDQGIAKDCAQGPLKSATIKALAAKLAEVRASV